jgi:hypothetical protein
MIETYTRPLSPDEREEITEDLDNPRRPLRLALIYLAISVALAVVGFLMAAAIWGIVSTEWPTMIVGTLVLVPGVIAFFSLLLFALVGSSVPRIYLEERRLQMKALAEAPGLRTLLGRDEVAVTRVNAVRVTEIVIDEDFDSIYLFELGDGATYYHESAMMEVSPWPSTEFEVVRGLDGDKTVWERVCGTGDILEPAVTIDDPWCYDGFDRLIHRMDGEDAFADGVYNEGPDELLARLLGTRSVDTESEESASN